MNEHCNNYHKYMSYRAPKGKTKRLIGLQNIKSGAIIPFSALSLHTVKILMKNRDDKIYVRHGVWYKAVWEEVEQ